VNQDQHVGMFKATDTFAIDAYSASRRLKGGKGRLIASEIRRTAIQSGGAVVAASASEPGGELERSHLQRARSALIESRYYLYLARRFGLMDPKRYRLLASRQDAALRELESFLRPTPGTRGTLESPILR
jgi:four helix bundle protein